MNLQGTLALDPQEASSTACPDLSAQIRAQNAALTGARIAIVTDAWHPQVNGVVRTLDTVIGKLRDWGHEVLVISPDMFTSIPCPTYSEIRLALTLPGQIGKRLSAFQPDAIHLSTEGPLCWAARKYCTKNGHPFSTAFHTLFPDYVAQRTGLSAEIFWPFIKRFHARSSNILVATPTLANTLRERQLEPIAMWGRGVDLSCFTADAPKPKLYKRLNGPIQLYVGRVAVEKNIEAFLRLSAPGSKVVVGDGPQLGELQKAYPDAHFVGRQTGRELAGYYAGADVFIFPSRTDTFGLVMIEAMACGTPVAAYPVCGPLDIVTEKSGSLDESLAIAVKAALTKDRREVEAYGRSFSWDNSALQFLHGLRATNLQGECSPLDACL